MENCLEDHGDIEEAAVIGVPDVEWGEVVKAVLVPRAGAALTPEGVNAWCKSRIASFKAPQYIAIVDALPRNAMGKVLKTDLRERFGAPANDLA